MNKNAAEFKTEQDDVFGRISSRYDTLCDLFSFGIHRLWKRKVATLISDEPWTVLLDVASGTGDIVKRIVDKKHFTENAKIIASDISPKMLYLAEKKLKPYEEFIEYQILNAHDLNSIETSSIDAYSMSLGLKICNREKALTEAFRVLRPGGRIITLEASNIKPDWLHQLYLRYMAICIPLLGWIASNGDKSAYGYLLQGVNDFPTAEALQTEMENIGFTDVSFTRLSLGIVAIHIARKPA